MLACLYARHEQADRRFADPLRSSALVRVFSVFASARAPRVRDPGRAALRHALALERLVLALVLDRVASHLKPPLVFVRFWSAVLLARHLGLALKSLVTRRGALRVIDRFSPLPAVLLGPVIVTRCIARDFASLLGFVLVRHAGERCTSGASELRRSRSYWIEPVTLSVFCTRIVPVVAPAANP